MLFFLASGIKIGSSSIIIILKDSEVSCPASSIALTSIGKVPPYPTSSGKSYSVTFPVASILSSKKLNAEPTELLITSIQREN